MAAAQAPVDFTWLSVPKRPQGCCFFLQQIQDTSAGLSAGLRPGVFRVLRVPPSPVPETRRVGDQRSGMRSQASARDRA